MLRYRHSLWSPVWDVGSSVQVSVAMRELGRGEGGGYDSYIAWFPAPPKETGIPILYLVSIWEHCTPGSTPLPWQPP